MNKQKNIIEFIVYLVLLIVGVIFLLKGFHKRDFVLFPEPEPSPTITNAEPISNDLITYDYCFMEDE